MPITAKLLTLLLKISSHIDVANNNRKHLPAGVLKSPIFSTANGSLDFYLLQLVRETGQITCNVEKYQQLSLYTYVLSITFWPL